MSVITTQNVRLWNGRFMHDEAFVTGDVSGGVIECILRFPRALGAFIRVNIYCQIFGSLGLGYPRLFLESNFTAEQGELSWDSQVSATPNASLSYRAKDIPLWAFQRARGEQEKLTGIYATFGNLATNSMRLGIYAELEEPESPKNRRFSIPGFFKKLDQYLFGGQELPPMGLSTP